MARGCEPGWYGIHFMQAVIALEDEFAITIEDDHPSEARFITLGMDENSRVLVVVYTFRGEAIRIISARKATSTERQVYERDRL
jgi:uncharacterized DUF497 family protein